MISVVAMRSFYYFYIGTVVVAILVLMMLVGVDSPLPWALLPLFVVVPVLHMKIFRLPYLAWNGRYSVGVKEIDGDHKRLVDLINRVVSASSHNLGDEYVRETIVELVDYTRYHLGREEELMDQYAYPDRETHKLQHQRLIDGIVEFEQRLQGNLKVRNDKMFDFLRAWLLKHISMNDKELGSFIKAKRAGV